MYVFVYVFIYVFMHVFIYVFMTSIECAAPTYGSPLCTGCCPQPPSLFLSLSLFVSFFSLTTNGTTTNAGVQTKFGKNAWLQDKECVGRNKSSKSSISCPQRLPKCHRDSSTGLTVFLPSTIALCKFQLFEMPFLGNFD